MANKRKRSELDKKIVVYAIEFDLYEPYTYKVTLDIHRDGFDIYEVTLDMNGDESDIYKDGLDSKGAEFDIYEDVFDIHEDKSQGSSPEQTEWTPEKPRRSPLSEISPYPYASIAPEECGSIWYNPREGLIRAEHPYCLDATRVEPTSQEDSLPDKLRHEEHAKPKSHGDDEEKAETYKFPGPQHCPRTIQLCCLILSLLNLWWTSVREPEIEEVILAMSNLSLKMTEPAFGARHWAWRTCFLFRGRRDVPSVNIRETKPQLCSWPAG